MEIENIPFSEIPVDYSINSALQPDAPIEVPVKKRGRPKGSRNKPKDPLAVAKPKGRPGRPKGSRNKKTVLGSVAVDQAIYDEIPINQSTRYEGGFLVTDYTVIGNDRCPVCRKKSRRIVSYPVEKLPNGAVSIDWNHPRVSHLHRTTLVGCFEVFDSFCEEASGLSVIRSGGWSGGRSEIQGESNPGVGEVCGVLQADVPRALGDGLPGDSVPTDSVSGPSGELGV